MVAKNPALASLRDLRFWASPDDFQAGSLHAHPTVWEELLLGVTKNTHADLIAIIYEGVIIKQFFTHCKGDFRGKRLDFDRPPPIVLENSRSCDGLADLNPPPYCSGCRPVCCLSGARFTGSHRPILFSSLRLIPQSLVYDA